MPDRSAPCFGEHPVARGARRGNNIIISSSVRPQPKIAKTNSAQKNRRRRPTAGGSSCLWVALLTDVAHVGAPLAHEDSARERRTPLEMPDRSAPCFGEHPVARGARRGNNNIISSSVRPQPKIAKTNSAQKNRRRRPTAGGSSCLWVALLTDVAHVGAPLAHEDSARERRTPAAADDVVVAAASAASHGVLAKAWR